MIFQIRLIYLNRLWGTYRNTGHAPNTFMFSNRIRFIGVVFSLSSFSVLPVPSLVAFVVSIAGTSCSVLIPLKYLYRTGFYASPTSNTRIPIYCNHSTMNSILHILPPLLYRRPILHCWFIFLHQFAPDPKHSESAHYQNGYAFKLPYDVLETLDLLA